MRLFVARSCLVDALPATRPAAFLAVCVAVSLFVRLPHHAVLERSWRPEMTVLRGRAMSASSPACETLAAATNRRNATGTIGVVATAQSTGPLSGSAWSISSGAVRGHKWAPSSAMDDVACSAVGMDSISDTHHSVGTTAHRSQVAPMPPVSSPANPGNFCLITLLKNLCSMYQGLY